MKLKVYEPGEIDEEDKGNANNPAILVSS